MCLLISNCISIFCVLYIVWIEEYNEDEKFDKNGWLIVLVGFFFVFILLFFSFFLVYWFSIANVNSFIFDKTSVKLVYYLLFWMFLSLIHWWNILYHIFFKEYQWNGQPTLCDQFMFNFLIKMWLYIFPLIGYIDIEVVALSSHGLYLIVKLGNTQWSGYLL